MQLIAEYENFRVVLNVKKHLYTYEQKERILWEQIPEQKVPDKYKIRMLIEIKQDYERNIEWEF